LFGMWDRALTAYDIYILGNVKATGRVAQIIKYSLWARQYLKNRSLWSRGQCHTGGHVISHMSIRAQTISNSLLILLIMEMVNTRKS